MNNKSELLQQLNRLKRDERVLKTDELEIRRLKAAKDQREPLALNHEKRMKNKRQQSRLLTEIRNVDPLPAPDLGLKASGEAPLSSPPVVPPIV